MKHTFQRAKTQKQKKEILNKLFKIWNKVPHWRLGQLLANYMLEKYKDIFFIEDYDLINDLDEYIRSKV